MDTALSLDRVAGLGDDDRAALRELSEAVYPPAEWADWPGRRIEWAAAEWCVRVWHEGRLACHVGILVRDAELDGQTVRVGGIGGVKTHPALRRSGLAGLAMRRAVAFFHEQPAVAFALLVCEPPLLAYYAALGWREFTGRLRVRQHGVSSDFTFEPAMTHGVRSPAPAAGFIDLNGPPW
jgi:hypothetical protein